MVTKSLRLFIIAPGLYCSELFKEMMLKSVLPLRWWRLCVCVCVCVYTLFFCLFPRCNHTHGVAAREAPSQHVHDRGQVRAARRPSLTNAARQRGEGAPSSPEATLPNGTLSDRRGAQGKLVKRVGAYDLQFLLLSLFAHEFGSFWLVTWTPEPACLGLNSGLTTC